MISNLQVISGTYRGRKLALPNGARPTQNLARGAIFNMLAGIVPQNTKILVWDAFAGAGALGIEVLSRYPNAGIAFTDVSEDSIRCIQKNINGIPVGRVRVVQTDALNSVSKYGENADIIFVDPPYADAQIGIDFVAKLAKTVRSGTIVVQEIEKNVPYAPDEGKWEILRDKVYGRARFLILRRNNNK